MKPVGPLGVLVRRRHFRLFFLGVTASRLGDTFLAVALAWLILKIGTPTDLGLLILIGGAPRAVGAPVAGYVLDRYGPRLALVVDNGLRAVLLLVIPLLSSAGALRVVYLYPLVFAGALLSSATEVGQEIVAPTLVADDELEAANGLLAATFDLAEWVGPAAAGLTVALAGVQPAIVVDACSFLGMAAAATALPAAGGRPTERATRSTMADLVHGYRTLRACRGVLTLTLTALGVLTIDGALQVFWPAYSRTTLGSGPATYGLLVSAAGVGSLAGTLLLTPVVGRLRPSRSLPLAVAGSGLCLALLAAIHTVVIAVGLAVLVGVLAAPFYPIARAVLQRLVPEHERGRVFGARASITACGFPTGAAVGGLLLTGTSAPVTALIIAAAHAPIALGLLAFPSRPEGDEESATESRLAATCGRESEGEELSTIGGQQVDHLLA